MDNPAMIEDAVFMHSVLCQAFLPYRNPGDDVRRYEQQQGNASLLLTAGDLYNPKTKKFDQVGLPYGAKARLVLAYLNTMAIKTQDPNINIEESLTGFVKKLDLDPGGKTIRSVKEQLNRLAGTMINIGYSISDDRGLQGKTGIIDTMELWLGKDEDQRVLWPGVVKLSPRFFDDLMAHSIPMDERVIAALSNNAMAMDIYVWLVQRLHRVPHNKPAKVSWKAISDQFGGDNYTQIRKFRQNFRTSMKLVMGYYQDAKVEDTRSGLVLYNSPPPIGKTLIQLPKSK